MARRFLIATFVSLAWLFCLPALLVAEPVKPFWEVATKRPLIAGAPKYSDVIVRNRQPHPIPGKSDPFDTLQMLADFHVTRLDWTYNLTREFVGRVKSMGIAVGGALENDEHDAQGGNLLGRVTDPQGRLKTTAWFGPNRWVGCPNAPEYRAAWLYRAKLNVDLGVDLIQQDDPALSLRTKPPLCYCDYCKKAFALYQKVHGPDSSYEQFQRDSVLAFHQEMHRELDAYAGRHIPFSDNDEIGFHGKFSFTQSAFDFVNCEIDAKNIEPSRFYGTVTEAAGVPLVFQYRETSVGANRRFLALTYATGTWMMMPWDVYMPHDAPRYFGKAEDYADLSGFVRGNADVLDGYEDAAAVGKGIQDARYGAVAPLSIEGGSGEVYAFARARPGIADAPVVIHVVEWAKESKPMTLRLHGAEFGRRLSAKIRLPKPYDADLHAKAQKNGDFGSLIVENALDATTVVDDTAIAIPALDPWGIVVVRSESK